MDERLELAWTRGYNGSCAEYITEDVICFKCGNNITFVNSLDGNGSTIYPTAGDGLGVLTVHSVNKLFAYSENTINPRIFVVEYPSFTEVAQLSGGAQLEVLLLACSSSEFLASISGIPEYQLVVWRYTDGTKLCTQNLSHVSPTGLSFNPGNWRQICISTKKDLNLWTIEQNNDVYLMNIQKVGLPAEKEDEDDLLSSSISKMRMSQKVALRLPLSSIAGLKHDEAVKFEEHLDSHRHVVPVSHCWTPSGDLLIGCAGGQLVRIDVETYVARILLQPGDSMLADGDNAADVPHVRLESANLAKHNEVSAKKSSGRGSRAVLTRGLSLVMASRGTSVDRSKSGSATKSSKSRTKVDKDVTDGSPERSEQPTKADVVENSNDKDSTLTTPTPPADIVPGSFNCIQLHKRGLYTVGSDGFLRRIVFYSPSVAAVVEKEEIGIPMTSLSFPVSHNRLAIGSSKGALLLADPENLKNITTLFDIHHGNFVVVQPIMSNPGFCVTLREFGHVQVWATSTGDIVSTLSLDCKAICMATSSLIDIAAIGSDSGTIYIVDLTVVQQPKIVHGLQLHQGPINCISFLPSGCAFVTGSVDDHVFVVNGRSSKRFEPIGYANVPGIIDNIVMHTNPLVADTTKIVLTSHASDDQMMGLTKLITFNIPSNVSDDFTSQCASLKCDFKDSVINKVSLNLTEPLTSIELTDNTSLFALAQMSKNLLVTNLASVNIEMKEPLLKFNDQYGGHQLPGGVIRLSADRKWIASGGTDGRLIIRDVSKLENVIDINVHSYSNGGIRDFLFLLDGSCIVTIGFDGALCCYRCKFTEQGQAMQSTASTTARFSDYDLRQKELLAIKMFGNWTKPEQSLITEDQKKEEADNEIEEAIKNDEIYNPPPLKPPPSATWVEVKRIEALTEESTQFKDAKGKLRTEIREIRRKLQKMLQENEALPQIEKLARHEFDLDTEEQKRLQAECEQEVTKLRDEKEYENIAKMYIADLIKKECWEDMAVKGRGIIAFSGNLEVYNYPLKERSLEELNELEIVKSRRKIEMAERQARIEYSPVLNTMSSMLTSDEDAVPETAEGVEEINKGKSALTGSLADEVGGDTSLYYDQFQLCSREQKIAQITLIQDVLYQIKVKFNKEFEEVFARKEAEIAKISEKNVRIRRILNDLLMPDDVFEPKMGAIEKPEMLFTTTDDEVKVEKYLTPEQWKKLEQERQLEEERRLREKGDNWRDRGLERMMGGVLEIKKEDELKKDIPIPMFMQDKPAEDWNEEEKKHATEYQHKVKDLEEERDKYRKQLEVEMKKLQQLVQEGTVAFDELLQQLFTRRTKMELNIFLEELKIVRLSQSILTEEELLNSEQELEEAKDLNRKLAQAKTVEVNVAKKQLEEFRTDYDILVAEDKIMDKSFKRDFSDVPIQLIDVLYKQYRRRPRGKKANTAEPSANPFADRPSTARNADDFRNALEAALAELNNEHYMPEGCDPAVWERLCRHRREKLESETQIKQKALVLAEMQAFVQKRQKEEEQLQLEMEELYDASSRMRETKQRFMTNLEIQLILKQGQVEVDPGAFVPNYTNSLLIHRSVVEDLNKRIRQLGESKIVSMIESKDFKKGIIQLEWEHKKMLMEMMDLKNKMKDITNMKVTREIQQFLSENDYDSKKNQQVLGLEQTISQLKQNHERRVAKKKEELKELKRSMQQMKARNDELQYELTELNVSVNERKNIHQDNTEKQIEIDREARYKSLVQRRKMIDLAQAQTAEVSLLRTEVERLRMRTFAALVQVER